MMYDNGATRHRGSIFVLEPNQGVICSSSVRHMSNYFASWTCFIRFIHFRRLLRTAFLFVMNILRMKFLQFFNVDGENGSRRIEGYY